MSLEASSGRTTRHRLNRGGDRQLNRAVHIVVVQRVRHDERTRAYAARRSAEGKSDREIRRCLKRYLTRHLFRVMEHHDAGHHDAGHDTAGAGGRGASGRPRAAT